MAMVVTTGQCGNCYQCRNSYVNEEQETQSMCGSPSIAPCAIAEQTFCAGVEYSFTVGGNDYKANDQTCAVAKDKEIACAALRATVKSQFGDVGDFVCRAAFINVDVGSKANGWDFPDWEEFTKQYLEDAAAAEETKEDDDENNGGSYVSSETQLTASILLVGIVSFLV